MFNENKYSEGYITTSFNKIKFNEILVGMVALDIINEVQLEVINKNGAMVTFKYTNPAKIEYPGDPNTFSLTETEYYNSNIGFSDMIYPAAIKYKPVNSDVEVIDIISFDENIRLFKNGHTTYIIFIDDVNVMWNSDLNVMMYISLNRDNKPIIHGFNLKSKYKSADFIMEQNLSIVNSTKSEILQLVKYICEILKFEIISFNAETTEISIKSNSGISLYKLGNALEHLILKYISR